MHQNIIFKNIGGKVVIFVDQTMSFDSFIESFTSRLDKLYIKDELLKTNVILDISNIELDAKRILRIFDALSTNSSIFIDRILYKKKINKNIILHEGNVRAGEIILFNNNTLLIGNINRGAKVIATGNLYVIGKASGNVELKGINNKLTCSSLDNLYIKICSFEKKFEGVIDNIIIRVEEGKLIEENFMDGRDKIYGKSNSCYIW
jgi:hypothetical protein